MNKLLSVIFLSFISLYGNDFQYQYQSGDKFSLVVRGNYRYYLDGKYIGLKSNEIKSMFVVNHTENDYLFNGSIYYLSKMIRENLNSGFELINQETCTFNIDKEGNYKQISNDYFPLFRWIPFFPEEKMEIGKIYEMPGNAVVDLYENQLKEIMPVHFM